MIGSDAEQRPALHDRLTCIAIDPDVPKPADRSWQGNDAEWDRALPQFTLDPRTRLAAM